MKTKRFTLPIIILILGLLVIVSFHAFSNIVKLPTVTERDFPFSVTYELGEKKETLALTYRCTLSDNSENASDPTERYYEGVVVESGKSGALHLTVDEKNGRELVLHLELYPDLLMGDPYYDDYYEDIPYEPILLVYDEYGYEYDDSDSISRFDARVTDWTLPEPIENTFRFSHIGRVSANSIFPMLIGSYVTLLACMIFVKKDRFLPASNLNVFSVIFNFVLALLLAPFIGLVAALTQIYTSGTELTYQVFYCIPAITVFCVSVSLCLRRRGLSKSGFYVQFIGPVLFLICAIADLI